MDINSRAVMSLHSIFTTQHGNNLTTHDCHPCPTCSTTLVWPSHQCFHSTSPTTAQWYLLADITKVATSASLLMAKHLHTTVQSSAQAHQLVPCQSHLPPSPCQSRHLVWPTCLRSSVVEASPFFATRCTSALVGSVLNLHTISKGHQYTAGSAAAPRHHQGEQPINGLSPTCTLDSASCWWHTTLL